MKDRAKSFSEQLFEAEWNRRLAGEETDFQKRYQSEKEKLEIDAAIRRLPAKLLHPRWGGKHPRVQFGRRCLEVAVDAALAARSARLSEHLVPDWDAGLKHLNNARGSLDALLNWMARGRGSWRTEGTEPIKPALHGLTLNLDADKHPLFREAETERRAAALIEARAILAGLPDVWNAARESLVGQNPGTPEKAQFVHVLAEAWTYICRKPPSLGPVSPFASFVIHAWNDVGGFHIGTPDDVESFSHAIRQAVQDFRDGRAEHWRPNWVIHPVDMPG